MDTQTAAKKNVDAEVAIIKAKMPGVYKAIQARAARKAGTFELVRRGLRGDRACFYAFEGGHVVGTPFTGDPIMADVASNLVQFGCAYVCIFDETEEGQGNGAN